MKRIWIIAGLLALAAFASAQSLPEYLRVRREHHVDHAVGLDALKGFDGDKVMELRGTVSNFSRSGHMTSFFVGDASGNMQEVEADAVPDWLLGTDIQARLLVHVGCPDGVSVAQVKLIGAARDEDLNKIEGQEAAKRERAAERAAAAKAARAAANSAEPVRDTRGGLFGPIGRHSGQPRTVPKNDAKTAYAAFIKTINPRLTDSEAYVMADSLIEYCMGYQVDPRLVVAVVYVESGFDPTSVSHSGAMGLGQLMPDTARWMGVSHPFNVVENIFGMVKLLHYHINEYSSAGRSHEQVLSLALAAYNAGEGAVRKYGGVPPYAETQAYVPRVLNLYYRLGGQ